MLTSLLIKKTSTNDPDFITLIRQLDHELWHELNENQATYDPFNKVPDLPTAVVLYLNKLPVACGCFKKIDKDTAEVKRMYVDKTQRGKGLSKMILKEIEGWAIENGFSKTILETSIHFKIARSLYENAGYIIIDNYGPYKRLPDSVCMQKTLEKE
ncbi:MAG: GNAT family N-acetyltransferase [Ferruginibacter sp.]